MEYYKGNAFFTCPSYLECCPTLLIKSISNNRQNAVYIQPCINVLLVRFDRICALLAYCLPVAQHLCNVYTLISGTSAQRDCKLNCQLSWWQGVKIHTVYYKYGTFLKGGRIIRSRFGRVGEILGGKIIIIFGKIWGGGVNI